MVTRHADSTFGSSEPRIPVYLRDPNSSWYELQGQRENDYHTGFAENRLNASGRAIKGSEGKETSLNDKERNTEFEDQRQLIMKEERERARARAKERARERAREREKPEDFSIYKEDKISTSKIISFKDHESEKLAQEIRDKEGIGFVLIEKKQKESNNQNTGDDIFLISRNGGEAKFEISRSQLTELRAKGTNEEKLTLNIYDKDQNKVKKETHALSQDFLKQMARDLDPNYYLSQEQIILENNIKPGSKSSLIISNVGKNKFELTFETNDGNIAKSTTTYSIEKESNDQLKIVAGGSRIFLGEAKLKEFKKSLESAIEKKLLDLKIDLNSLKTIYEMSDCLIDDKDSKQNLKDKISSQANNLKLTNGESSSSIAESIATKDDHFTTSLKKIAMEESTEEARTIQRRFREASLLKDDWRKLTPESIIKLANKEKSLIPSFLYGNLELETKKGVKFEISSKSASLYSFNEISESNDFKNDKALYDENKNLLTGKGQEQKQSFMDTVKSKVTGFVSKVASYFTKKELDTRSTTVTAELVAVSNTRPNTSQDSSPKEIPQTSLSQVPPDKTQAIKGEVAGCFAVFKKYVVGVKEANSKDGASINLPNTQKISANQDLSGRGSR
ncbi:MAG: hypothetical protein ACO26G_04320 [Rickettsiales bacterium]